MSTMSRLLEPQAPADASAPAGPDPSTEPTEPTEPVKPAPALTAQALAALHRQLDRSLAFPPEYHAELSSHLPMALHALAGLGADEARLASFFDRYAQRFERGAGASADEAHRAGGPAGPADLGRIDRFAAWRAHFEQALQAEGRDTVLRAALPMLMPGVAAAAFHGPIRVAHAVQSGHLGELAQALAYWAARWQALPSASALSAEPSASTWPFDDWADALLTQASGVAVPRGLISQGMAAAAGSPAFLALAGRLQIDASTRDRLAAWAAELYARSGNFTVLHMVTACRAMRVLTPWVDEGHGAALDLVRAYTAALLASGVARELTDTVRASDRGPLSSWPQLTAAAIASDDDHVIKLVHACAEEEAWLIGPQRAMPARAATPWLSAAARALR